MGIKVREKPRDSGIFWVFINFKGQRRSKRIGSQEAANRVKEVLEAQIKLGTFKVAKPACTTTLAAHYEKYRDGYMQTVIKASSRAIYKSSFNRYIIPILGHKQLAAIDRAEVKSLVAHLVNKGLARNTISRVMTALSSLMMDAVDDGLLPASPVSRLAKFYKNAPKRTVIDPLTFEESKLYLATARQVAPEYYPALLTALHTGLRLGELVGLEWQDIDFHGKFVVVRRSAPNGNRRLKSVTPKAGRQSDRVDLSASVLAELSRVKKLRQAELLSLGINELPTTERIFRLSMKKRIGCSSQYLGESIGRTGLRWQHGRVLQKAGLRSIRFHDLRHTFISQLLMLGHSPAYVQKQARHADISTTISIYSHWIPGYNREAVDTLPVDGVKVAVPAK